MWKSKRTTGEPNLLSSNPKVQCRSYIFIPLRESVCALPVAKTEVKLGDDKKEQSGLDHYIVIHACSLNV